MAYPGATFAIVKPRGQLAEYRTLYATPGASPSLDGSAAQIHPEVPSPPPPRDGGTQQTMPYPWMDTAHYLREPIIKEEALAGVGDW